MLAAILGSKFGMSIMYVKNDFMKLILLNFIYLVASVVGSFYDVKATDLQDKKGSNDNARVKKKILLFYPPKKPKK